MKLTSNVLVLLGFLMIINSSCGMETVIEQFAESIESGDAILVLEESYPVASIKELNVTTSGGSILVTGDADQDAVLEMYVNANKNGNYTNDEIKEILDRDYEIEIRETNGVLHAHAKRKNNLISNWKNSLSISFKIRTGSAINSELSTSGGRIELANLRGNQSFRTSGGRLNIENLSGDITGETSGGSIQAINGQGNIHLTTSGGSIQLMNLDGDVRVSTSGGSISGQQITGSLFAETSGGGIQLEDMACKLNASTSGGSVTVDMRKLIGDVELSTSAGSVNLTLPMDAAADLNLRGSSVNVSSLSNFEGSNARGKLVGRLNGGGVRVDASTSAGGVNLNVK